MRSGYMAGWPDGIPASVTPGAIAGSRAIADLYDIGAARQRHAVRVELEETEADGSLCHAVSWDGADERDRVEAG